MVNITLNMEFVDIDIKNWEKCISLSVSEEQKGFVAPNVYSLAESKFETDMCPIGICVNGEMIGFIMYVKDPTAKKAWITRFMILV